MITEQDKLECESILDEQETQRVYKAGDIIRWSYSRKYIDSLKYQGDLYWCKSRIAVFSCGKFVDTFWHGGSNNNLSFGPEEIGERFRIEYVGNFNALDRQNDYSKFEDFNKYYEVADIVDLNHSNNSRGNLYLRKGAKRSLTKVKERLEYKIKRTQEQIDHLKWVLDQEKEKLANLSEETVTDIYF